MNTYKISHHNYPTTVKYFKSSATEQDVIDYFFNFYRSFFNLSYSKVTSVKIAKRFNMTQVVNGLNRKFAFNPGHESKALSIIGLTTVNVIEFDWLEQI